MSIIHNTSVDFTRRVISEPVHIVQGDRTLPTLAVELLSDGQPYTVPDGAQVNIALNKKDGTFVLNKADSVDGNIATFTITAQMAAVAGDFTPEVQIVNGAEQATTGKFPYIVDKAEIQEGMIESTSEVTSLIDYADRAEKAADRAQEAADKADTAAINTEAAEKAATDAAASATAAATSEKNAADSAIAAADSATASANSATAAKASEDASAKTLTDIGTAKEEAVSAIGDAKTEAEGKAEEAEAWAVGTRNGEPVPVSDPTYENNAKYWAEQAEQTDIGQVNEEIADIVNVYGSKNLMETTAPSYTQNGITKTVNADGSFTLNGTATNNTYFYWMRQTKFPTENIQYTYSIETSAVWGIGQTIAGIDKISETAYIDRYKSIFADGTTHIEGTFTGESGYYALAWIFIPKGTQLTNVIVKGMLRLASIQDDTWVPYVPTNKELMSCKLNGYVGAKNLLPYPYKNTTKSENGVTFTDNGDGTITVNTPTSASAETTFYLSQSIQSILDTGMYILSGCPSGGNRTSGYFMEFSELATSSSNWKMFGTDTGEGAIAHIDSTRYVIHAYIRIRSGATVSNLTFKPMIRRVEDTDSTWKPYAMTNRELTEDIKAIECDKTTAGTYTLQCVVDSSGNKTYSWV